MHCSDDATLVLLMRRSTAVVDVLTLEGGELAGAECAQDGVAGADVPLLDEGHVHVDVLVALDHLPGFEAGSAGGSDLGFSAEDLEEKLTA